MKALNKFAQKIAPFPLRDEKKYRWGMYGLLAVLVVASICLSVAVNETYNSVKLKVTPLLAEKIPLLQGVADFESALLRYQLALNKYFARSVSRERFLLIEEEERKKMEKTFEYTLKNLSSPEDVSEIQYSYSLVLTAGKKFDEEMQRPIPNAEKIRGILFGLNTNTVEIRTRLDELQMKLESATVQGANEVIQDVNESSILVHAYTAASLLIALFLILQFRARLASNRKLIFQAWHDPLTKLPHRLYFEHRLGVLDNIPHTIVLCAADRFDHIVGGVGHQRADHLILKIARNIQEVASRHEGEVFRLYGANIAILYKLANDHPDFHTALMDLKALGATPFVVGQQEIPVTFSWGACEYPMHGEDPTELLKNADAALTAAKELGGDGYVFYSQSLNERSEDKLALEAALGRAVEKGELELHYQPQYDVVQGCLVGFEALVRWRRNGQLVSPIDFIPIAESSGLIVQIGDWILKEACSQIKKWNDNLDDKLQMAINISPRQFNHPEFMLMVRRHLMQSGVEPKWIEFEITESVMVRRPERAALLMRHLRHLGIRLAIDDFGTGYSSLSYLKNFPISKLKIDQSFIKGLKPGSSDAAIVQSVIALGHKLNVVVIAEGVEDREQLDLLSKWHCDQIQGYLYSRPLPKNSAAEFIELKSYAIVQA